MTRKALGIASAAIVVALLGVAVTVGNNLPPDLRLPTHWGIDGRPDDFSGKWPALLMPAGLTAFVSLLFWFLPTIEPRGVNFSRSTGLYLSTWAALLLVMVGIDVAILSGALHWDLPVDRIIPFSVGLLFVIMGNQLGKSRSMYLVGIRTPWTLASEEVWMKTHRLGGKLMVLGGLVMVVGAFVTLPARTEAILYGTVLAIVVLVPIVYSYMIWRREQRGDQSNG